MTDTKQNDEAVKDKEKRAREAEEKAAEARKNAMGDHEKKAEQHMNNK